jgi:protein-tyrosine-phosphatase/tRNA A37 threonylcarbamoyladenosine synthetase subunit TsaC/SUA5/YrdC
MPEVLDWQRVAEPHAVIHYAVQSLQEGRTVAFPTETGYAVTASGLAPEAVRRLPVNGVGETGATPVLPELTLALRGAAEARDWAPGMSRLGLRLTRRLWPGPVTLLVGGDVERGLASRLPEEVRTRLCVESKVHLAIPCHEALCEVLRHLPGPLLMAAATAENQADVIVADESVAQTQPATVIAVNGDAWEIARPGALSAEEIRRLSACWIVFVCTGNTCRSPLAEALCKKLLADHLGCAIEELPSRGYFVASAGLSALPGGAAAAEAEQVARAHGADLSAHRSQPMTVELAARADYLVGMTQSHVRALMDDFGSLGLSPRLLDPAGDIADPIGGDQPVYDACAQQIRQHLETFVAEIAPTSPQRQQGGGGQS